MDSVAADYTVVHPVELAFFHCHIVLSGRIGLPNGFIGEYVKAGRGDDD